MSIHCKLVKILSIVSAIVRDSISNTKPPDETLRKVLRSSSSGWWRTTLQTYLHLFQIRTSTHLYTKGRIRRDNESPQSFTTSTPIMLMQVCLLRVYHRPKLSFSLWVHTFKRARKRPWTPLCSKLVTDSSCAHSL